VFKYNRNISDDWITISCPLKKTDLKFQDMGFPYISAVEDNAAIELDKIRPPE
jgi:hypothetical protein